MEEKLKTITFKKIPTGILQKYKAWCSFNGLSMNEDIIDYMEQQGKKISVDEVSKK